MILLNVGNLFTESYLDQVISWNGVLELSKGDKGIKVASLFGSLAGLTPTARSRDRIPERDWEFLEHYVQKARDHGIEHRWTLNQSCIGSIQEFKLEWPLLKRTCQRLHDLGIREWTITSPLLMELLRELFPQDFLEVSTIAEVSTPEEVESWVDRGADGVNLSTRIIRDFRVLKRMGRQATVDFSLLANEACLHNICPWRRECYNLSSHDSLRSEDLFHHYPFQRCNFMRITRPVEWIKSHLILPQWMCKYQELTGISWFKVAFRTHPSEVALPILRMYMEEKWDGNLLALWPTISHLGGTEEPQAQTFISCKKLDELHFLEYFIANGHQCQILTCDECGYCHRIMEECHDH